MSAVKPEATRPAERPRDLVEERERMIAAQKQVEQDLQEFRKKAPHIHPEDHQVVISI